MAKLMTILDVSTITFLCCPYILIVKDYIIHIHTEATSKLFFLWNGNYNFHVWYVELLNEICNQS